MIIRILVSLFLLISILFMPLWVSVIMAIAEMIYFDIFWEAVAMLLLSDLLYGVKEAKFHGVIFVSFIMSIILLITIEFLKKKTRFYK